MKRRTSLSGGTSVAIDKEIDSKFDDVKIVADNIEEVVGVSSNINTVINVNNNLPVITTVSTNIQDVIGVNTIRDDISAVEAIHSSIVALSNSVNKITSLYNDLDVLNSIYEYKAKLDSIFADKVKLDSLYNDKTTLDSLYADKITLDSLYADKAKLDGVFNDLEAINSVYTKLVEVKKVADSINDVVTVSLEVVPNLDELLLVNGKAAQVAVDLAATTAMKEAAVVAKTSAELAELNANNSAVTASNHLAAIEAIYNSFDDRYLGAFSTEPTLDNDGNILTIGAMYWDTVSSTLKFYNGTVWEDPEITVTQAAQDTLNSKEAAENSATAAAISESNANTYKQQSEAARDVSIISATSVQQIFLGEKTEDPVLDNLGNPLQIGVMYYNSVSGTLRIWTGAEWTLGAFSIAGAVASVNGRDGVVELTKSDVGLSDVDNTSDLNKPISTATQSALDTKVDKVVGKELSDENYTIEEKDKLAGIESGATADQTASEIKSLYESTPDKVLNDVNVLRLSTDAGVAANAGDIAWNPEEMTVDIALGNGVVLQAGEETLTTVENGSGTTIANGSIVMRVSSPGNSGKLVVIPYNSTAPGYTIVGIATSNIAAGSLGKVTSHGRVRGINTSAWTKDTILYVSGSGFTATKPTSGLQMMIATVLTQHATNGTILVRVGGYVQPEEW